MPQEFRRGAAGEAEVEVVACATVAVEALQTVTASAEVTFEAGQTVTLFLEGLSKLLQLLRQGELRVREGLHQVLDPVMRLLPDPEELLGELPERSALRRWQLEKPTAKELCEAHFQVKSLRPPCRRYLTLLGIVGETAKLETSHPGYYETKTNSELLAAEVVSDPAAAQAWILSQCGFRVRECPHGHRWLASPVSKAEVGCYLHANAIRIHRHRTGQAKPQARQRRGQARRKKRYRIQRRSHRSTHSAT